MLYEKFIGQLISFISISLKFGQNLTKIYNILYHCFIIKNITTYINF
ncbi:hypothetical protein pb186bvf_020153 [Paramecium bursaria]